MGAFDRGRAARRERLRGPLVRAEPPAARSGLVDGAPDQRVAEAKTAGHVGVAHKVALEELVERVHGRRLRAARGGGGELGLERVTRHGRTLQDPASRIREQRELLGQRGGHGPRHLDPGHRDPAGGRRSIPGATRRTGELLEIEGVAAGLLVERGRLGTVDPRAEQLACLLLGQGSQLQAGESAVAMGALERG